MPDDPTIRVLIVDDHLMLVESLVRILQEEPDIEVVSTAGTAKDGIAKTKALQPDVVLMDQRLPDMDGSEATRQLILHNPHAAVIIVTGFHSESLVLESITAGASGLVAKTRAVTDVVFAIRTVHAGGSAFPMEMVSKLVFDARDDRKTGSLELSVREKAVLDLMAAGLSNRQIAERLFIGYNTVRNHVQNILLKLGANSRLEAVVVAASTGLVRVRDR